jgi:hypothetical protein
MKLSMTFELCNSCTILIGYVWLILVLKITRVFIGTSGGVFLYKTRGRYYWGYTQIITALCWVMSPWCREESNQVSSGLSVCSLDRADVWGMVVDLCLWSDNLSLMRTHARALA